jgi:hypothetical protein
MLLGNEVVQHDEHSEVTGALWDQTRSGQAVAATQASESIGRHQLGVLQDVVSINMSVQGGHSALCT